MSVGLAIAAVATVAVATYLSRAGLILFLADRTLPAPVQRGLRHVAPAVLAALVVSLTAGGEGIDGVEGVELAALAVGAVTTAATKKLSWGLAAGMVVLWVLLALT